MNKLHILNLCASPVSNRNSIPGGNFRIRRVTKQLPAPPEQRIVAFPRTNTRCPSGFCTSAPIHSPLLGNQIDNKMIVPDLDIRILHCVPERARTISEPVASPFACKIRRWLCAPSLVSANSPFSKIKLRTHRIQDLQRLWCLHAQARQLPQANKDLHLRSVYLADDIPANPRPK